MSSEQGQCSIVEPERDLCFSIHLTSVLPPEDGAMPLFAAVQHPNWSMSASVPRGFRRRWSESGRADEAPLA
jgi:hypothetical protein